MCTSPWQDTGMPVIRGESFGASEES
jgi:hypothetical protein